MKRNSRKQGRPMKRPSRIGAIGKRKSEYPRQTDPNLPVADQVLIDHLRLDLLGVDRTGLFLGLPFVTCALDSSTRQVIGFSMSFVPPHRGD